MPCQSATVRPSQFVHEKEISRRYGTPLIAYVTTNSTSPPQIGLMGSLSLNSAIHSPGSRCSQLLLTIGPAVPLHFVTGFTLMAIVPWLGAHRQLRPFVQAVTTSLSSLSISATLQVPGTDTKLLAPSLVTNVTSYGPQCCGGFSRFTTCCTPIGPLLSPDTGPPGAFGLLPAAGVAEPTPRFAAQPEEQGPEGSPRSAS